MSSKRQEQAKFIEKMTKDGSVHFQKAEIEKLLAMYNRNVEETGSKKLDRLKFRDILHQMFEMTDDVLMDRVFRAFDQDTDNCINHVEWVTGLSIFLKGNIDEQIKFCFLAYDLNSDGYISREEMFQLLKPCLVKQPQEEDPDEGIKELVEICIKKLDLDHDNRLSINDFAQSIQKEPLLLEAFGPCLPKPKHCLAFLNTVGDEYGMKY